MEDHIYNLAIDKFNQQKYNDAVSLLRYIAILEPDNCLYLKALAGALQMNEEFEEAIICYNQIFKLKPIADNYDCIFFVANCFLSLKDIQNAILKLNNFIDLCEKNEFATIHFDKLIKRARLLIQAHR